MIRRLAPLAALLSILGCATAQTDLEATFRNPPASARPHTWWHWMSGHITREGLTADLEAMAKVGLGGAQMFDVQPGVPEGKVLYNSAEWRALTVHAVKEAQRLGIELCIHNCAGWSSSGGPWMKPEQGMQWVTVSETQVTGPKSLREKLAQPPTRLETYRDIAVLAFPTPPAEVKRLSEALPVATCSTPGTDPKRLLDGRAETAVTLSSPAAGKPQWVTIECVQPFTAQTLTLRAGPQRSAPRGELQVSDDGQAWRAVKPFSLPGRGDPNNVAVTFNPTTARYWRLLFATPLPSGTRLSVGEVELSNALRLDNWWDKAGYARQDRPRPDARTATSPEAVVEVARQVDLSAKMAADGTLTWDVPAGTWTILRVGYSPNGRNNHPVRDSGRGLESDKLSAAATDAHFDGMMLPLIQACGPLAGKSLNNCLIDSYEVGGQNWTPLLRQEFTKRRGYDPTPYLATYTGRVVTDIPTTERFLWDLRKTIAELQAENYFGRYAERCREYGLQMSIEPYGDGNFDELTAGVYADIPMTEFWSPNGVAYGGGKLASSIAHTQGRTFVGAEAFTASQENGRWLNDPWQIKPLGDAMWASGVNRFIFHRYAHQPWLNLEPGMTMGPWGFMFERTITWWEQAPAWTAYLARGQALLQAGRFVGDLLYFSGDDSPQGMPGQNPPPPPGYDWDAGDLTVLNQLVVKDGRLTLPSGAAYEVLILPPSETMLPSTLRRLDALVRAGATVVGQRPRRSPSLQDQPVADQQITALADSLWGPINGTTVTRHAVGAGQVVWGQPLAELLAARGVGPSLVWTSRGGPNQVRWMHRRAGNVDYWFVANLSRQVESGELSLRVSGRQPELWQAVDGSVRDAALWRQEAGRTVVTLALQPAESLFVVCRRPPAGLGARQLTFTASGTTTTPARPVRQLVITRATYGVLNVAAEDYHDVTQQVAAAVKNDRLELAASNALAGDPAPNVVKQMRVRYRYGGQERVLTVDENQTARLPEADQPGGGKLEIVKALYGLLPETDDPPVAGTVDVTRQLQERVREGALTVRADNSLAGDPANLVVKQLLVEYTLDGVAHRRMVQENDLLSIPDGPDPVFELPPAAAVERTAGGGFALTAWETGRYRLDTPAGEAQATIATLPAPLELGGPWQVSFQPNRGAPASASFEKLVSWPERPEPGIRYFSGSATYRRTFTVPALTADQVVLLDLGKVKNFAEVTVNGQQLATLWMPPFRVDVTKALRAGENALEVRVTNLWVNRLIGDEELPDDAEYAPGGQLKSLPTWLQSGSATPQRPPTGRITFSTWKHWQRGDALQESGLVGPVRLRYGLRQALQP
ncbi:MAG: DUF3395 domain-containing protein [Fimbriimonadaceae bacterium]|nr:DUF3395 domain-containing protein [Fimbriimonadaceae bacterium]